MSQQSPLLRFVLVTLIGVISLTPLLAQEPPAEHARRVITLMNQGKFEDVVAEFNAPVAAMISATQLREVWSGTLKQFGPFGKFIDDRVTMPAPGITQVAVGSQFENAALDVVIAFDAEHKIGGLRFAPRPAQPSTVQPTSTRFKEEAISVGSGEWTLPGTLSMPVGPIAAAVVLVHGSGPNDRDETLGPNKPFRDLAWGLADRGIAVLRYEKRTRQHAQKIAAIKDFTVREETTEDALLAVTALRAHTRIDPKRVFVLGHSLGGTLAPRIAAGDSQLAGIVIMAGATRPLPEVAREQIAYLSGPTATPDDQEKAVQALFKTAPPSYWKDLETYQPAAAAAKLTLPILVLHGERDYQVTMKDLKGWQDSLAGKPAASIKSYRALNHLFLAGEGPSMPAEYMRPSQIPEGVIDDIANWIKSVTKN